MNETMSWEKYEVSDLGLIVYLSLNFNVLDVNKSDPKRAKFVFDKTPELIEALDNYWNGKASVDPNRYFLQMKVIKSRIYGDV